MLIIIIMFLLPFVVIVIIVRKHSFRIISYELAQTIGLIKSKGKIRIV